MAARITVIACLWVYMHMRAFMSVYLSVIYYVCWYVCTVELAVSIRITKMILAEPKNTNILLFGCACVCTKYSSVCVYEKSPLCASIILSNSHCGTVSSFVAVCCSFYLYAVVIMISDTFPVNLKHAAHRLAVNAAHKPSTSTVLLVQFYHLCDSNWLS